MCQGDQEPESSHHQHTVLVSQGILRRTLRQQAALVSIATHQAVVKGALERAFGVITESVAEVSEVERVSVWMLDEDHFELCCADLYERTPATHSSGAVLHTSDYPRYFEALASGRAIDAHDACTDPRTSEFTEGYLKPLAISSMLDSPVRIAGKVIGVICQEHTGPPRNWSADEMAFAAAAADQVAQTLLNSQRKRAEDELLKAQRVVRSIINSMPSALIGIDLDGRITQWNLEAERATGVVEADAVGRPLNQVLPQLEPEMPRVEQAFQTRQTLKISAVPRDVFGEVRYEDITIYPLITDDVEGGLIRIDDVTERVRIEEMMIQSEKMLSVGGLAAGMAHEINNPLAGIMQNAAVISNRLSADLPANQQAAAAVGTSMDVIRSYVEKRQISKLLEHMNRAGSQAAQIVQNMLSFARKSESRFAPRNLAELLDKTLTLATSDYDLKKKYDFRRIEIVREYDQSMPKVQCEGSKLQQVFLNILRNGAEAMANQDSEVKPPRFILRIMAAGEMARIEIEDNGSGMSEPIRKRVFEPFFTTKPADLGTGLGLSVSYYIVTKNHGGTLSVESTPGQGSKFIISIPMHRA
jgi:PAS domain S-box-containing protein